MADILTDALRAAALRVMGYRTDVIEFVSSGDTPKNLMIRAEKILRPRPERRGGRVPCAARFLGREALHRGVARKRVAGALGVNRMYSQKQSAGLPHLRRFRKPARGAMSLQNTPITVQYDNGNRIAQE